MSSCSFYESLSNGHDSTATRNTEETIFEVPFNVNLLHPLKHMKTNTYARKPNNKVHRKFEKTTTKNNKVTTRQAISQYITIKKKKNNIMLSDSITNTWEIQDDNSFSSMSSHGSSSIESINNEEIDKMKMKYNHEEVPMYFREFSNENVNVFVNAGEPCGLAMVEPLDINEMKNNVFDPHDRLLSELLLLCDQARCPRYLLDNVLDLIETHTKAYNFSFNIHQMKRRDSLLKELYKANPIPPVESIIVTLESSQKVAVQRLPFLYMLQQSLTSHIYNDVGNLCIKNDDLFSFKPLPALYPNEIIGTNWYINSYEQFCLQKRGENMDFYHLMPFIIYMDGTNKSLKSIEPVVVCDGFIKESVRENINAWIQLGYIPDLLNHSKATSNVLSSRKSTNNYAIRDYHKCLRILLEPLYWIQKHEPILKIRRGERIIFKKIYPIIAFVPTDNKAGDAACARLLSKGPESLRMTRKCFTTFQEAERSDHICVHVDASIIDFLSQAALGCMYGYIGKLDDNSKEVISLLRKRHGNTKSTTTNELSLLHIPSIDISDNFENWVKFMDALPNRQTKRMYIWGRKLRQEVSEQILTKCLGSKVVDNAFSDLDFGANNNGIHSATLPDILHSLESGIIPVILDIVFEPMPSTQLSKIDTYVRDLFGPGVNRSGEKNRILRVSWRKGYTSSSYLTGKEKVGKLFVLAIILQTDKGQELLEPRFDIQFDVKKKSLEKRIKSNQKKETNPTQILPTQIF